MRLNIVVLLCLVALAKCHMTGICLSRISNGKLHVAVEHWHGSVGVRAGSSFAIRQGSLSVSGPWQAPLACGCPPSGCGTSYHDCGASCTGTGVWYAVVDDPGFTYPGTVFVDAINGGSVTERCGVCTGDGITTTATVVLPPPASTCFAQICGDGIISGGEVCEAGGTCAPGYPSTTCGTCCLTGTPCCQTGTARCQNHAVSLNGAGTASVSLSDIDNGSNLSPDCPQSGYPTISSTTITCANYPSTIVQLRVGPAGGSETCTATVAVSDPIGPSISCPSSVSRNTDADVCTARVTYSTPVGTDQCPGAVTTQISGSSSGSNFPLGGTTNVFRVTDQASNQASCSFSVTVTDAQGPRIDGTLGSTGCPAPISVSAASGSCAAPVTFVAPVGADNCPGATTVRTAGSASGSSFPVGTTSQSYRVTDDVGLTATCSFSVTVVDNQNPTITCPAAITVNTDTDVCGARVTYSAPSGSDNCPSQVTTRISGNGSGAVFPVGSTTETYRVTDAVGRTATCSFTVTVVDAQDPVIDGTDGSVACPSTFTVGTDNDVCSAVVPYTTPDGTDQCAGFVTAQSSGLSSGSTFPLGSTGNQYTVTDAAGRTNSCSFSVVVQDTQPPQIDGTQGSTACPAPISVNTTPGTCAAPVSFTAPVGTDACPGESTARTSGQASGTSFGLGTTTQTYVVTDDVGLTDSCSFTVTVSDIEGPLITCPSSFTVNSDLGVCGSFVTYAVPSGTDNCPNAITSRTTGLGSATVFPIGTTTETYLVTDGSGATATCSFTVTVIDVQVPVIDGTDSSTACPAPITVSTDSNSCSAVVSYVPPVGTDQCPGAVTTSAGGLPSGATFPQGSTANEYTVTDAAGLSSECFFTVTVQDNESPSIDGTNGSIGCPASFSANTDPAQCGASVTYTTPVGTDACPGVTTARTAGLRSGSFFPLGATSITFQATDGAGNTASCSFVVTVVDSQAPDIDGSNGSTGCPGPVTINAELDSCVAMVTYNTPDGSDQCPGVSTAQTSGLSSGSGFPVGVTTNAFTATDVALLTASCSFDVTVVDSQVPQIDGTQGSTACPASIVVNNDAGVCGASVSYTEPLGTDSCPGSITARTTGLGSGAVFPAPGPTTETYVVTDTAGQTASCSFTITVDDVELPVIDGSGGSTPCPSSSTVNTDTGVCHATITYTTPSGTDQCTASTALTAGLSSGADFPLGATMNTYVATDPAGNSASCSFTITVLDQEDPRIDGSLGSVACPASIAVNNDPGQCGAVVLYTAPVGTDGCPGAITAQTAGLGSSSFFPVGSTTETYVVTDAAGRTASCSFTVTVVDNESPTLNSSNGFTPCMPPVVVPNDAGVCSAVVNYAVPVGIDNCGSLTPTLVSGFGTGGTFPQFQSTETYTVSDSSGNSVTCSFEVVVEDREPPVISHSPPGVVEAFPGVAYGYAVTMTDNCSPDSYSHLSGPMSGDSSAVATDRTSVWFEGVDVAGNIVQYEFQVQTILIATGIPVPTYMYLPMTLQVASSAFASSDTHVSYQLRPIGGGQPAFESARAEMRSSMDFEGAFDVLPGRWEFWMVGWPSANARYGQEFILCASQNFCY